MFRQDQHSQISFFKVYRRDAMMRPDRFDLMLSVTPEELANKVCLLIEKLSLARISACD